MKELLLIILIILIAVGIYFLAQPKSEQNQDQQDSKIFNIQGMKIEILKQGTGSAAEKGDTVTVNYVGTLQDGTKFDSSIDRNLPFEFILGQNKVIQGWELGVVGMNVGEKRKLTIPPELAYGAEGHPPIIPSNATLVFEIDLLSVKGK